MTQYVIAGILFVLGALNALRCLLKPISNSRTFLFGSFLFSIASILWAVAIILKLKLNPTFGPLQDIGAVLFIVSGSILLVSQSQQSKLKRNHLD